MPLGAFAASSEMMAEWQTQPVLGHITTFGGHPVSCAAALASLKILLRENWIDEAERKSSIYKMAMESHPLVKEVRSSGLLIAVDLGTKENAQKIMPLLLDEGVMSDWFLFSPCSFRIAPPLSISDEEIEWSLVRIKRALDRL